MKKYLVNVPVANLRREPIELRMGQDTLQETQLLFNESLRGAEVNNGWVFVEAIEQQKCFASGEWGGYPGWVRADQLIEVAEFPKCNLCVTVPWAQIENRKLSIGTRLEGIEELPNTWKVKLPDGTNGEIAKSEVESSKEWRSEIIKRGIPLLGSPYFWGGRSAFSMDCSGLVQLLYRTVGFSLPRDAHDQFLQCRRCESNHLEVGDLVFLAKSNKPGRISHVMIYAGDDQLLEAEMKAGVVRMVSAPQKLGVSLKNLPSGYNNGEHLVYPTSKWPFK